IMLSLPLMVGAFVAGLAMFLAPCTLPIVPGYLAFIAGGRGKVMRNAIAFVLGFSAVFIVLGLFAGEAGALLGGWKTYIAQGAGLLLIVFGLTMLGVRIPLLSHERHAGLPRLAVGHMWGSVLIGALFALGWSPCIGPILGTVLLLASQSATALQGALLLALFSAGLGLPFLLTAYFIDAAGGLFARLGSFTVAFNYVGAVLLIGTGALMLTNQMGVFVAWGLSHFGTFYNALLPYM
ncbi:MAG: cytochrome c biogenesis protein CcdA, partial [Patescibacteria group bacterium]